MRQGLSRERRRLAGGGESLLLQATKANLKEERLQGKLNAARRDANWLPEPAAPFSLFMPLYVPQGAAGA
jgi:hypothetical protein